MTQIKNFIIGVLAAMSPTLLLAQSMKQNFDLNWNFGWAQQKILSEDIGNWKQVNLPHDWDINYAPAADARTGNDGGYYPGGFGCYKKSFIAPKLKQGDTLKLYFDGVYQNCEVYVNGQFAGRHGYGYTPFRIDITTLLRTGKNEVEVCVDNTSQPSCRWYSGSGIYRHVWLETYKENAVDDPQKLFMTTQQLYGISDDGTHADSAQLRIDYDGKLLELRTMKNVKLWSPEHPALYDIKVGTMTVKHGFRHFTYDAANGFVLNGIPTIINGACVHHDNGVIGAMSFDAAEVRKVRLMKEAGFNLIRTSHNPQSAAFYDACDSLGMMVIDEAFDGWYEQKTPYDYHLLIDSCYQEDITAMVLRDRNHPSIVCWSVGNEVIERKQLRVVQTAKNMKNVILRYDKSRPVTEALCSWDKDWEIFDPHAEVLDIVGYNYMMHKAESDHERCPERVMWQTESYPRDAFANWKHTTERPYIIGDIVWTGLDYLGESGIGQFYYEDETAGEHYSKPHFPFHGAYCGDVDITGWRKPISHYRDMLYNVKANDASFIYMAVKEHPEFHKPEGKISETMWSVWPTWESWTWPGMEGKELEVEIYCKAPMVKLTLNGKVLASSKMSLDNRYIMNVKVPYESGELLAVACDADGRECAIANLTTAGEPYAIRLTPDRKQINAGALDLSYITLEVVDKDGNVCPNASIPVDVTVAGTGSLLAAASSYFKDLEPKTSNHVTTYKGRAMVVVRSGMKKGQVKVSARSEKVSGSVSIATK